LQYKIKNKKYMNQFPAWLTKTVLGLGAILLLVVIISQIVSITKQYKNVDDKRIVTISAQGKITAKPDLSTIDTSVVANAFASQDAQNQNTVKTNAVIAFLKSQGILEKDIQTSNYNIYPNYDYANGKQSITGYTASQSLNVKIRNTNSIGAVLEGIVANGANQVQNVSYSFDNPDSFREQAREQALANAKDKAQKLAKAAGAEIGDLISFNEDQAQYPVTVPFNAKGSFGAGNAVQPAPQPQIEPGVQDITAQVTVTYSLK